jgi:branched-chain amino acid transport system permease protein
VKEQTRTEPSDVPHSSKGRSARRSQFAIRHSPFAILDSLLGHGNLVMFVVLAIVLAVMPVWVTNNYHLGILVFVGLNTMLTVGLSLLMGYTGQISLGHAVFYGSGAYITGLLATRFGWSPWPAVAVAALATAGLAYVIGIPIFRLRGHYLAMATLGLNIILEAVLITETEWTGGPNGMLDIPRLSIGNWVLSSDQAYYYVVWAIALIILALSLNIVNSRVGRALRAIHASELAAASMGVDVNAFKLKVLVLSAIYASVAGSLFAFYLQIVTPASFNFIFSIQLVVMVAIGGLASVWGAIFGAATVTLLSEVLRNVMPHLVRGASAEVEILAFGIILILIMVFMPEGLTTGMVNRARRWRDISEPWADEPLPEESAVR